MTRHRPARPAGLVLAIVLAVGALYLGWLALKAMAVRTAPEGTSAVSRIVADDPDVVLGRAAAEFTLSRGSLSAATLAKVRSAALHAPLDARPYLFIGADYLAHGDKDRGLKALEAGRRLDPRQRWIHVLLLDRYLRTRRFDDAAAEFAVLARLVSQASGPIAGVLGQMAANPETRPVVQQALRTNPALEGNVLKALAASGNSPALVFSLASPAAFASVGTKDGWGSALVDAAVARGDFAQARSVWSRVYRVPAALSATPIYDGDLKGLPGAPPFNWTLSAGSIGAADLRGGRLNVDYYGRDTGELASELLLLGPGRYRFGFILSGAPSAAGTTLSWTLDCAGKQKRPQLMNAALPAATTARRPVVVEAVVPGDCPAQSLKLIGNAPEFAAPMQVSIERITMQRLSPHS